MYKRQLPSLPGGPPLLREHRLYQADWLLRFYGFKAEELLSEKKPNFNLFLDPKCDWALQNLKDFPVEINKASYEQLLRIPGVGVKSARRIISARKQGKLDFDGLKRIGVVLKRARSFITCSGKMEVSFRLDEDSSTSALKMCIRDRAYNCICFCPGKSRRDMDSWLQGSENLPEIHSFLPHGLL